MEKDYKGKFIGEKKISSVKETEEKTSGDIVIVKVSYEDESIEHFSSLMFPKVVSDKPCDETELMLKRIDPIVEQLLRIVRDWGMKEYEMQPMVSRLTESLNFNANEAMFELISKWMPRPNRIDGIDYMTIDRILRSIHKVDNMIKKDGPPASS